MAIDYTSRDFQSLKRDMINALLVKAPELSNKNDSEFAVAMIELFAYVGDLLSYALDRYKNEVYLPSAIQKENVSKICSMLDYRLYNYEPSKVLLTFSIIEPHDKRIIIPAKTTCMTEGMSPVVFETDEISFIEIGETSVTIKATQGETHEEILGYSDGSSNQEYNLTYSQVLDGIQIFVESESYTEIDNFINSNKDSKYFVVERSGDKKSKISFGNGVNGYIPEENYQILASYRVGGGLVGNVSMNSINSIIDQIYDEDGDMVDVSVTNEEDATGGLDEESIASAKAKAPAQVYTLWRAVTKEDFVKLALTISDVQQAVAILDSVSSSTTVYLYIKLLNRDDIPTVRLQELYDFFNERKLIGVVVIINEPVYREAVVNINVLAHTGYLNSEVKTKIEDYINQNYTAGSLGFGEQILDGEIVDELMDWDEIKNARVTINNGETLENEIIKIGSLNIVVTGGK
ncbi:MAG: Baseplate protein [Sedimentibacter sp.]|jgi:hypothetical protein|nr:Baseplate protein [Sedimentibacter sp.]